MSVSIKYVEENGDFDEGVLKDVVADEGLKLDKNSDGDYYSEGERTSPQLTTTRVGELKDSKISWEEELNGGEIIVETAVDPDPDESYKWGLNTWDELIWASEKDYEWEECTNGDPIPNPPDNLENNSIIIRQTLSTDDTSQSPILKNLELELTTSVNNKDDSTLSSAKTERIKGITEGIGELTSITENNSMYMPKEVINKATAIYDETLNFPPFSDTDSFDKDAELLYKKFIEVIETANLESLNATNLFISHFYESDLEADYSSIVSLLENDTDKFKPDYSQEINFNHFTRNEKIESSFNKIFGLEEQEDISELTSMFDFVFSLLKFSFERKIKEEIDWRLYGWAFDVLQKADWLSEEDVNGEWNEVETAKSDWKEV